MIPLDVLPTTTKGHTSTPRLLKQLCDSEGVESQVAALALAIKKDCPNLSKLVLVGIHTGGVHLAHRIKRHLEAEGISIACGAIDITLYRDDLFDGLPRPQVGLTQLPSSIEGKWVVLVDDVLFTGRTIRSALYELMDFGRALCVRLAVLVDRGHRELPIHADYVGLNWATTREETVRVRLVETHGQDEIVLLGKGA